MRRLRWLGLALTAALPLFAQDTLEGTVVRNPSGDLGVRLSSSGDVVPLKHVEGLSSLC